MTKILLDVRSAQEFISGHKEGAINLPIENIVSGDLGPLNNLDKEIEINCYCLSGGRASIALNLLKNKYGFKKVFNLGGF